MLTFRQSIRHAFAKGVALSLVLMLAFALIPAQSAFANGDVGAYATCTETATLVESGSSVRAGGISSCDTAVSIQWLIVTYTVDGAPVSTDSDNCYGEASCSLELPAQLKLPGGHIYCSHVHVTYIDGLGNYDQNCDWFWF